MLKAIIFDLGGVIVNIDYNETVKTFHEYGFDQFRDHFSFHAQMDIFDHYEMGLISDQDFRNQIRERLNHWVSDSEFDHAWNSMIKDIPPERIPLLGKVKSFYPTFLLSNTNSIHIEFFNRYVHDTFGLKDLSVLFNKMYYSFEVQLRKPDVAIYEHVLADQNLKPDEVIFIDDNPNNVKGSRLAGIPTVHLTNGLEITDIFNTETGEFTGWKWVEL